MKVIVILFLISCAAAEKTSKDGQEDTTRDISDDANKNDIKIKVGETLIDILDQFAINVKELVEKATVEQGILLEKVQKTKQKLNKLQTNLAKKEVELAEALQGSLKRLSLKSLDKLFGSRDDAGNLPEIDEQLLKLRFDAEELFKSLSAKVNPVHGNLFHKDGNRR